MKIGIDARFYGPEGTGIGRYVEKLLENLEIIDQENEYFVFLKKSNFPLFNPKSNKFTKVLVDAHWYSLKEQVLLPAAISKFKLDFVHFPHFNVPLLFKGKFAVTIHDLTKTKFGRNAGQPTSTPKYLTRKAIYDLTLSNTLKRAEVVLTPSEFVKKELIKQFRLNEQKIFVTAEAADDFQNKDILSSDGRSKEVFNKFSINQPYLLYVGNLYPYKNVDLVVDALLKIDANVKFVVVSKRDGLSEKLLRKAQDMGIKNRVVFTGTVSDDDLRILYHNALCFVFPSLSEGFGLPCLEAMNMDCPVVSSNKTCLPEIFGEAALYFNPKSVKDLSEKLKMISNNSKLRNELIKRGKEKAGNYSWKKTTEKTLAVYKKFDV